MAEAATAPSVASKLASKFRARRSLVDSPYPGVAEESATPPVAAESKSRTRLIAIAGTATVAVMAGVIALIVGRGTANTSTIAPLSISEQSGDSASSDSGSVIAGTSNTLRGFGAGSGQRKTVINSASLEAASNALAQGNLDVARTQIAMMSKGQDNDPAVRHLTDQLFAHIRARDEALSNARACEQAGDMPCVLRSASNALASDWTSEEARSMLLRTATKQGLSAPAIVANNADVDTDTDSGVPVLKRRHVHARRAAARYESSLAVNDVYARH